MAGRRGLSIHIIHNKRFISPSGVVRVSDIWLTDSHFSPGLMGINAPANSQSADSLLHISLSLSHLIRPEWNKLNKHMQSVHKVNSLHPSRIS